MDLPWAGLALLAGTLLVSATVAAVPDGVDPADPLLRVGCLDVTRPPYGADPSGSRDSTAAIQRAVNDARDHRLVCFFPSGTYLISDTISAEQQVQQLPRPRTTDGRTQHYWDLPHRIVMLGSTRGPRPVLRLAPGAAGFGDPARPKLAVWVWAQTRDDAPGRQEPEWGKEQPNISFSHFFRGIDLDIRGHAGAIGLRHSGSQGSTIQDVTVLADGAYAGLSNCCGQGGGTYNVEVRGGRYGIEIDPGSRFPLLSACRFEGQTEACVSYTRGGSQVPSLFVGCSFRPAGGVVVDLTGQPRYAGLNLIDCRIETRPGGVVCRTERPVDLVLEDCHVSGAATVSSGGGALPAAGWSLVRRYCSTAAQSVRLINGVAGAGELLDVSSAAGPPEIGALQARHYVPGPSFEDPDAVNVRDLGATGDGKTDDTAAFQAAVAAHAKVFVPPGQYLLSGVLELGPTTQLFGLASSFTAIGGPAGSERFGGMADENSFRLSTPDDPEAAPGVHFLGVRGTVAWRSGRGVLMLAPGRLTFGRNGGGRLHGVMARGQPVLLEGIRQPTAFYAMNVERVRSDPQSTIRDCQQVRVFYFKVEAGTMNVAGAPDANTPALIVNSNGVRVYCFTGVVRHMGDKPMLRIEDSTDVLVTHLQTLQPGEFPHLVETAGGMRTSLPADRRCTLYLRD